ncbi:MAG: FecR family protein [Armatimonadia bacterium]
MFGIFGKKKKAPQTSQALLSDALSDLLHDQQVKDKRKRRRRLGLPGWLDRRLLIGLAIIFVLVIADAVRRENQEFSAVVTNFGGTVTAQPPDGPAAPVKIKQKLVDRTNVVTAAGSWADLSFPDGSKVALDGNTDFQVKLLEYHRGGQWRSRSFFLKSGRIFARIGQNFGKESELRVYTPGCVAAARGTRFSVQAEASGGARTVCGDGVVEVKGFNGDRMFVRGSGECSATPGTSPTRPVVAPSSDLAAFRHASMNEIIRTDPWYKQAELTITQTLDAPLTILGIGKCSWAVGAADFARRTNAQEALRKIRVNLEGDANYPLWVNPATLEELQIKEEGGVENILKNFDGAGIESYRSDGRRFLITVRARDRHRTRYELTQSVIRRSKDQD